MTNPLKSASDDVRLLLHAFRGLQKLDEIISTAAQSEQLASEASARLEALRKQIADTEAKAKADADAREAKALAVAADAKAISDKANELMSTAKAKAAETAKDAKERADAVTKKAGERAAKLEAEVAVLSESVKAKVAEITSLDARIAEARATLRKFTEV